MAGTAINIAGLQVATARNFIPRPVPQEGQNAPGNFIHQAGGPGPEWMAQHGQAYVQAPPLQYHPPAMAIGGQMYGGGVIHEVAIGAAFMGVPIVNGGRAMTPQEAQEMAHHMMMDANVGAGEVLNHQMAHLDDLNDD